MSKPKPPKLLNENFVKDLRNDLMRIFHQIITAMRANGEADESALDDPVQEIDNWLWYRTRAGRKAWIKEFSQGHKDDN